MGLRNLDQSKYTLDEIFKRVKANDSVKRLLSEFHEKLIASLEERNSIVTSRTHQSGITYLYGNTKRKAFLYMNIRSEYLSASINEIDKGKWHQKMDIKSSVLFEIHNELDMKKAINYSLDAYKIATDDDSKDFSTDEENFIRRVESFQPGLVIAFFEKLDELLLHLKLSSHDERVTFMCSASGLIFMIGGRYGMSIYHKKGEVVFGVVTSQAIDDNSDQFRTKFNSFFTRLKSFESVSKNFNLIKEGCYNQLAITTKSNFLRYANPYFEKAAFDKTYRSKILKAPITMNLPSAPLNQILFGPPGTGKTYNSIDLAVKIATGNSLDHKSNKAEFDRLRDEGIIEFVTFHQNYTYEDFMVGIKPDIDNSNLRFVPYKGIFYQLCKKARDNYEASHLTTKLQSFDELVEEMLAKISDDQPLELKTLRGKPFWLTDYSDKTIYLRKSTGSEIHTLSITTLIEVAEGRREMVSGLGAYYYPIIEYLKKNRKAAGTAEPLKNFVLVIDEINRANISKVFGELITLLEDDKRLGQDNELRISLPNGEKDFGIPPNLYVIGTMNTADKSIALIDIALRRRFEFIGYYPKYDGYNQQASNLLEKINEKIYSLKNSADYLIGHAYFMNGNSIEATLRKKVIPLLMEYFSGKINLVSDIFKETDWSVSYNTKTYLWDIQPKAE